MGIKCENEFCIYQENNLCLLDTIELDNSGICQSCICPNIPKEILEREKEKLRIRRE